MISKTETPPLTNPEKWSRYLGDMRSFSADKLPLETQGRLVRVTGLVLEAAGIRVPVGSVCEVRMEGQAPVIAEVVGFSGDRAYLMPTAEVHGPEEGLHALAQLPEAVTMDYQPFWALKAQLLQQLGADQQATATAFRRAIGLTEDGAVRAYLIGKSTHQAG